MRTAQPGQSDVSVAVLCIGAARELALPWAALRQQGLLVEFAAEPAEGFAKLSLRTYDAIVVDLKPSDWYGLAFLEQLRASGYATPVIVVTDSSDLRTLLRRSPLNIEDVMLGPLNEGLLDTALRKLSEAQHRQLERPSGVAPGQPPLLDFTARYQLFAALDAFRRDSARLVSETSRRDVLIAALIRAMMNPMLDVSTLAVCASALKMTIAGGPDGGTVDLIASRAIAGLRASSGDGVQAAGTIVRTAIAAVEASIKNGRRLSEVEAAGRAHTTRTHLAHLFAREVGMSYSEWRTLFSTRMTLRLLIETDIRISEVAYRVGFEHPSELTREFTRRLGMSPRQFRQLAKAVRRNPSNSDPITLRTGPLPSHCSPSSD